MDLFNAAVEQPPEARAAFVERSCDGDKALRRKIELLLKYHDKSGDFIKSPAFEAAPELLAGDPETLIGQNLGCYRVDAVAGVGGMGIVYLAWDERLGRKVALKLLPESMVANEAELARLKREARTASALNHPNIVTIHDIGEVGSIHYVAAEFIEGTTLRERMTKGPIPPNEAVDIAAQVASALCVAHRAGIVHRDIKPENIMLRPDGYVKVLDFGIAKLTQQETLGMTTLLGAQLPTQQSMMLGTTRYMSPEQAMAQQVDARSDLWSLGVVLYEMLAGSAPFEGETTADVMAAIFERDPQPLKQAAPIVPAALQSVVDRSLRKDPAERYQSAEEMLSELRAIKEKVDSMATRGARWVAVAAVAAIVAGLSLFYASRGGRTAPARATAVTEKSIAVLPFENLSDEKEHAAFADGVQDDILTKLARIADLKVISRTSVMDYRGKRNVRQIGNDLRVSHVLEGSVRRTGTHLRLNAQLIDTRTDTHVWAEEYDRDLNDLFAVQSEIAQTVAARLNAKITAAEKLAIERKPTGDLVAFDLYSRAKNRIPNPSRAGAARLGQAIDLLKQAVVRDPSFFEAYCDLASVHDKLYFYGHDHTPARLASAEAAIHEAFRIRPTAGEAHLARAVHLYNGYRDYDGALAELEVARRTLPNDPRVFELTGYIQRRQGRWEESIRSLERAIELDPRDIRMLYQIGDSYAFLRRYAEQKSQFDRILAIEPNNLGAKAERAFVELYWKADTGPLHELINQIRTTNPAARPKIYDSDAWLLCALAERDVAAAKEALMASKDVLLGDDVVHFTLSFVEGVIARMTNDEQKAQLAFTAARVQQERTVQAQADYGPAWCVLGLIDAALGRKDEALREGRRAVELLPLEKDPIFGLTMIKYFALIAAWVGEKDLACEQLATAVRLPNSGFHLSYGELKLMPWWDPLRGDPRFEKILEESKNPVALTTSLPPEKSIAVLPFENLSKDEENAFFASGVQDEILTNLAKIADLKVISRTSVTKYKTDLERNLREIANTLGVSHVVEGSVQSAGGRVRVSAQLIDARNDTHLWAEHYDRDVADVFAIQSEIAQQIANQLRARLSAAEKAAIEERPTDDPVAYAYYTKANGIDIWGNWESAEQSAKQRVELLEKATQRDPNFALAYCALAKAQADCAEDPKHLELAKKAAEAALRLRPNFGDGHRELARYYYLTREFDRARDELTIARTRLPNDSETFRITAEIDRIQNRWDASLANFEKASELDPRNVEVAWLLGRTYFRMRRYADLEQLLTKQNTTGGPLEEPWIKMALAEIKLAQGNPVAAQSLLEQVPLDFSPTGEIWDTRFTAVLYLRNYDAADRVIAAIPATWADEVFGHESWAEAQVARARGDKEKALATFAAAREKLEATYSDKPKDEWYFALAGGVDAGLGQKQDAIREALHAVGLKPITKDAYWGPEFVTNLALVYAWTGERDRALEQLETVATTLGLGPTYGDLLLNPCWDDLRGDPRFDKIVAAAKATSR
jgi:eukaryotic-like serine/threonine-protein kinase